MASEHACWPMGPISEKRSRKVVAVNPVLRRYPCLAAASGISSTIRDDVSLPLGWLRSVVMPLLYPLGLFRLAGNLRSPMVCAIAKHRGQAFFALSGRLAKSSALHPSGFDELMVNTTANASTDRPQLAVNGQICWHG